MLLFGIRFFLVHLDLLVCNNGNVSYRLSDFLFFSVLFVSLCFDMIRCFEVEMAKSSKNKTKFETTLAVQSLLLVLSFQSGHSGGRCRVFPNPRSKPSFVLSSRLGKTLPFVCLEPDYPRNFCFVSDPRALSGPEMTMKVVASNPHPYNFYLGIFNSIDQILFDSISQILFGVV